jgi:hypothetical protein
MSEEEQAGEAEPLADGALRQPRIHEQGPGNARTAPQDAQPHAANVPMTQPIGSACVSPTTRLEPRIRVPNT